MKVNNFNVLNIYLLNLILFTYFFSTIYLLHIVKKNYFNLFICIYNFNGFISFTQVLEL